MSFVCLQDIHSRFRNDKFGDVVARFNERFLLSLSQCGNCLVVDDELNVLPISSSSRYIKPVDEAVLCFYALMSDGGSGD